MIYMTTDEWEEILKIVEEKDFDMLTMNIAIRTYDLDISEQELDRIIKDYETKEEKAKKKEQTWVSSGSLDFYLRSGWTHVFTKNGSLVKREEKRVEKRDYLLTTYYLLER